MFLFFDTNGYESKVESVLICWLVGQPRVFVCWVFNLTSENLRPLTAKFGCGFLQWMTSEIFKGAVHNVFNSRSIKLPKEIYCLPPFRGRGLYLDG